MSEEAKECYNNIMRTLQTMEENVDKLIECVEELKNRHDEEEEVCPDEIAADKAAYEAVREICLDSLFDVESKGDA